MATINRFEDIEAWKQARTLCKLFFDTWKADLNFSRDFELLNQMKKSSGSVMDNIAEGFGRGNRKEFIYFLGVSKGSGSEFRSQLYRAMDQGYISKETFDDLYTKSDLISAKTARFIDYLNRTDIRGSRYKVEEPTENYTDQETISFENFENN
ncbi:MAG TPA: four helix bundle protein [Bacteroidia bacterium]|jgi:four helix bundle protein|nr:four helix bundle protein [Bacteroidia bacterium]